MRTAIVVLDAIFLVLMVVFVIQTRLRMRRWR